MRVYVAGIRIAPEHEVKTLADKIHYITMMLEAISEDAIVECGEDALIFVVMCEFALTPTVPGAIPHEEWETALAVLSELVKNYKNMILIPGAASSYNKLKDKKESETLLGNYREITTHPDLATCDMSIAAGEDLKRKLERQSDISKYIILRNCAYLLTSKGVTERHKSLPYLEYELLPHEESNSIFYIGTSNPIVRVATDCGEFNIGLLICTEHNILKLPADTTQDNVPIFQVIVSASVELNLDMLFAALSIQMDSNDHLKVALNSNHCQAGILEDIHCYVYHTNNIAREKIDVIEFKGKKFDEAQLQEKPEAPQPSAAPIGLRRNGFTKFSLNRPVWPRKSPEYNDDKADNLRGGPSFGNGNSNN